jgi:hypothetical protein
MERREKTAIFSQFEIAPKGAILLQNQWISGLPFFVSEMTVLVMHFLFCSNG